MYIDQINILYLVIFRTFSTNNIRFKTHSRFVFLKNDFVRVYLCSDDFFPKVFTKKITSFSAIL